MIRHHHQIQSAPTPDWHLIFDASLYPNAIDDVNNITGTLNAYSSFNASKQALATGTVQMASNSVTFDMTGTTFKTKMDTTRKIKLQFDLWCTSFSTSYPRFFPLIFGPLGSTTAWATGDIVIESQVYRAGIAEQYISYGSAIPHNQWATLTYVIDLDSMTATVTNSVNTNVSVLDLSGYTINTNTFRCVGVFKRLSGAANGQFNGYVKNVKVWYWE